jgi:outer membrane protein OmpA-like peptidoglycan-associated protein
LSENRALSVRSYLIQSGVAANRIEAVGYGMTRPIASNATPEGRAQNRRVEILIIPIQQ